MIKNKQTNIMPLIQFSVRHVLPLLPKILDIFVLAAKNFILFFCKTVFFVLITCVQPSAIEV